MGATPGTNTVTATSTGLSGSPVTFNATGRTVTSVVLTPTSANIKIGGAATLTVAVTYNDSSTDSDVVWSSSAPSVATVSTSGVVTGVATGSATITATSNIDPGKFATAPITVSPSEIMLTAADGTANGRFGGAVAIDGNTAIVGAINSAYVFTKSGVIWTQVAKLTASDAAAGDLFGFSVSISGDTVVVGARDDDDAGTDSGSAYVFVRPGGGWVDTTEDAKLTAFDAFGGDEFGYSVSISGDTIVVGAPEDNVAFTDQGSAYVFVRPSPSGVWVNATEDAKLTASDAALSDKFGESVSISGDTIVIGSSVHDVGGNTFQGTAYVFVRPSPSGVWVNTTEDVKLTASDGAINDAFGKSVAIDGGTVVVGAVGDDPRGSGSGSAYVFTGSGSTWTEQVQLIPADGLQNDSFGGAVAIDGDTIVVGAEQDDDLGNISGSAYVFTRSGVIWTQQAKLTASDGAANDRFGESVAISGNDKMVGSRWHDVGANADQGTGYIF